MGYLGGGGFEGDGGGLGGAEFYFGWRGVRGVIVGEEGVGSGGEVGKDEVAAVVGEGAVIVAGHLGIDADAGRNGGVVFCEGAFKSGPWSERQGVGAFEFFAGGIDVAVIGGDEENVRG